MNPVLVEIYSTILPSAPYLIAAYVLLWLIVFIWMFTQFKKQTRLAQRIEILEEKLSEEKK